jgi:glutamate transport system substrate-binding protein
MITSRLRRSRSVGSAAVAAVAVALLAACSSGAPATIVTIGSASGAGTASGPSLKIGVPFDQPGLGLKNGSSLTGFDIQTAVYVAKALGVPESNITWVEADPADREKLLTDGKVDLIFSTYSITPERDAIVDFAGPYFVAHQDLLVRRNDTSLTGPEALGGRTLCSVPGTTSAKLVTEQYAGQITLTPFPTFSQCVEALVAGNVDAVTTDDVILAGFAAEPQYRGVLKVVGKGFSTERYGVGVKNNDPATVAKINAALTTYISDGSWRAALDSTVGASGYAIPAPPTPGQLS